MLIARTPGARCRPRTTRPRPPQQRSGQPGTEQPDIRPELTGTLADPQLWAAVRALPERQRHAVILRYVADLDHAAIAATLATSPP